MALDLSFHNKQQFGTKDHEHLYTVYEYKYHLIVPGTILIHSERSRRHDYRKCYPQEGTRGSFQFWDKGDHDLTVTMI